MGHGGVNSGSDSVDDVLYRLAQVAGRFTGGTPLL